MLTAVVLLVSIASTIYWYLWWNRDYWKRRGITGPQPAFFYGNAKSVFQWKHPALLQIKEWGKEYGKVFGYTEGLFKILVISDIDMLQELFVKQFDNFYGRRLQPFAGNVDNDKNVNVFSARGARWKRLRAISSPSFSTSSLKKIRPLLEECAIHMVNLMETKHQNGMPFNIHQYFMEYTMDTISRLVMGEKKCRQFENDNTDLAKRIFNQEKDNILLYATVGLPGFRVIGRLIARFSDSLLLPAVKLHGRMESAVRNRVEKRAMLESSSEPEDEETTASDDFIDLFLDSSADFDFANHGPFSNSEGVSKQMTVDEVITNCFLFILAGFDTTSNALGFTSWMLAKYPDVQQKVFEEIEENCLDESVSYDDLTKLKYTEAVLKETLRFYPLGGQAASRTCMEPTTLGGIPIEKNTLVVANSYAVHFDKNIYGEDADEFKPERWLDSSRRVPPVAFLAFGGGPRICIGMRLAVMEEKIALVHLLRKFRLEKDEKMNDLTLVGTFTLSPVSVSVVLRPRTTGEN